MPPTRAKESNWKGGLNTFANPVDLPGDEAIICRNQGVSAYGVLSPRSGYYRYSTTLAGEVMGMAEVDIHDLVSRLVVDKTGVVSKFDLANDTSTSIKTGLTTQNYAFADIKCINDVGAIITNGIDRPQFFDGVNIRDCGSEDFPSFTESILNGDDGGLYTFSVKVSWYDEENDYESELSPASNMVNSVAGNPALKLDLSRLSAAVPSRFSHFNIYRTMPDGDEYFFCERIAKTVTSHTLTKTDAELGRLASFDNSPMPAMPFLTTGFGRFFVTGNTTYSTGRIAAITLDSTVVTGNTSGDNATGWKKEMVGKYLVVTGDEDHKYLIAGVDETHQVIRIRPPYRGTTGTDVEYKIISDEWNVYYCGKSPLGKPLPEQWSARNRIQVKYADNERITGICGEEDNVLVFFYDTVRAIVMGDNGFVTTSLPVDTGAASHRAICVDSRGNFYFFSGHKLGVWRYNTATKECENIGIAIQPTLRALDATKFKYAHMTYCDYRLKLFLTTTSAGTNQVGDICYTWDERLNDGRGGWFEEETLQASCSAVFGVSDVDKVAIGDDYGYLYLGDTGTNDGANLLSSAERTNVGTVSGAASSLTDSGQTWTVNECKGIYLAIVSGTGAGERKRITSNTATTLTISGTWTSTPDSTSVYSVGGIRFRRKRGWLVGKNAMRYWRLYVYQTPQASGNATVNIYRDFNATAVYSKTIDLSKGVNVVNFDIRGEAISYEIAQDLAGVSFAIHALTLEMDEIAGKAVQEKQNV